LEHELAAKERQVSCGEINKNYVFVLLDEN